MKLKNAPRDAGELLQLSKSKRFKLFQQLTHTEEEENAFLAAPDETQAMVLSQRITTLDEESKPVFVTTSVTLPMRTEDEKLNEKLMGKFSRRIEKILNEMKGTGYGQFNMLQFNEHGMVIIGHRQASGPFDGALPPPGMLAAMMGQSPPSGLQMTQASATEDQHGLHISSFRIKDPVMKERLMQLCSRAYNIVDSLDSDELKDKHLNEWVEIHMGEAPSEVTKIFIKEIDRLHHEHIIASDHDEECPLTESFIKVKALLEQRVHLGTN